MNRKSTIIIGGGLGGLFTGALLAKEGHQVTIIEKNANIGGGIQSFYRFGEHFDTGMHIVGGFKNNGSVFKICNHLGIIPKLKLQDVDAACIDEITFLSDNKTYRIPEGKENFIRYFQSEFPDEKDNTEKYVNKIFALTDEVDLFYLREQRSNNFAHDEMFFAPADELIAHYIKNEKLREILAYMNPMCGGAAGHTPAYIFALINVLYINGQSRFKGASNQLAFALKDVIENAGGKVIAGKKVIALDIDNKQVTNIITEDGMQYSGDYYISTIHPAALMKLTNDKLFTKAYRDRMSNIKNTYSAFCVYIKLKPNSFRYINHPCYIEADYKNAWNQGNYDCENWPYGCICLTPCNENQGEYATKMEIIAMMPFSACSKWAETTVGHRSEEYNDWKKKHEQKILQFVSQKFPDIEDCIEEIFSASPLTIRDYYNIPEGALYGIFKDCKNLHGSFVSIHTKAANLYQTGQNVYLHGCCGVPLTAINTVEAITGKRMVIRNFEF